MGRPFKDISSRRKNLNMRCTDQMRNMVEAAAKRSGRCLSDEVLARVTQSVRDDDLRTMIREEVRAALAEADGSIAEPIGSPPPAYAQ